ncbi:penicillin-binding protein 2 [Fodinisporobacter ferrooxydans]|uniref:Penicillin-binding protein 2 n=1 Tax=Fodinisporobacter ferrooxydans TaxID=2901836 RepID=A0ABY4CIH6_9BACL|nr:penicillin-binding protein 2 [Alicyclobacillaceae bacterium MYW30-H2]
MNQFERDDKEQSDVREFSISRLNVLFVIVFLILVSLVIRLGFLQLTKGATYRSLATDSHLDQMPIPAPRGFIYDRNHQLLVSDNPSFTLMYSGTLGKDEPQFKTLVNRIHNVIPEISEDEIGKRMTANPWLSVTHRVYTGLNEKQVSFIREHQNDFPGCNIIEEPQRNYLNGDLAGHVIGYLNSIPGDKASSYEQQGYQKDDKVGMAGVEMQYESYLRGKDGRLTVQVDSNNHLVHNFGMDPAPVKGDDLILNIDSGLQQAMQAILQQSVLDLQKKGKPAKTATAVAMNPSTGEIYAMASYPYFNPQWFVEGIGKHMQQWYVSQNNWAIQGLYPPGSTEKPLTAMAALQDGVITKNTSIDDSGEFVWDGGHFHDWVLSGHGKVDVERALAVSCDTFFYNVNYWFAGESDGPKAHSHVMDRLRYYQQAFGLGVPKTGTGIDLPYEASGFLSDGGNPGDLMFAAIGQDEEFTPISLAQYTSAIANGGKRMEPHIVKQIVDANGHVVKEFQPNVLNTVPVSPENLKIVQEGMQRVVTDPDGTAHYIFLGAPYTVAGKTGTAEVGTVPNNNDTSVFIGYAPVDHPQIAISVVVPAGGHSSDSIGPISRGIFDYYFQHMANQQTAAAVQGKQ